MGNTNYLATATLGTRRSMEARAEEDCNYDFHHPGVVMIPPSLSVRPSEALRDLEDMRSHPQSFYEPAVARSLLSPQRASAHRGMLNKRRNTIRLFLLRHECARVIWSWSLAEESRLTSRQHTNLERPANGIRGHADLSLSRHGADDNVSRSIASTIVPRHDI
jgi:hypothetical protein